MKNDRGCLCCLPSDIAAVLAGLANVALIIYLGIECDDCYEYFAVPVVSLLPVVWTFCDR